MILVHLVLNHCDKSFKQDMCAIFVKSGPLLIIRYSRDICSSWSLDVLTSYLKHPLLSCENEWEDVKQIMIQMMIPGFIYGGEQQAI